MNYSLLTLLIFALVIGLAFIYKKRKLNTSNPKKVSVSEIWILGIIANVISISLLLLDLNSSYENIQIKSDLSPSIVSGNIKMSIIHFF
jgi:paraquat-inducible protein B